MGITELIPQKREESLRTSETGTPFNLKTGLRRSRKNVCKEVTEEVHAAALELSNPWCIFIYKSVSKSLAFNRFCSFFHGSGYMRKILTCKLEWFRKQLSCCKVRLKRLILNSDICAGSHNLYQLLRNKQYLCLYPILKCIRYEVFQPSAEKGVSYYTDIVLWRQLKWVDKSTRAAGPWYWNPLNLQEGYFPSSPSISVAFCWIYAGMAFLWWRAQNQAQDCTCGLTNIK